MAQTLSTVPPQLHDAIHRADQQYNLPDDLLEGIWRVESGSHYPNPYVNSSGYGGLFGTHNWNASTQDQANTAAQILASLLHRDKGNVSQALSQYSGGGYTQVPGEVTFGTFDPGSTAAAGLGDAGTQTQQSSGTAPPAGSQTGVAQDASVTSFFSSPVSSVEKLFIRGLEVAVGGGLVLLGLVGVYLAVVKGSNNPAALLGVAGRAMPSGGAGGGAGGGSSASSSPTEEERAAARANRERRAEEQHQARVKLAQARATEVRTRQRHRRAQAAASKREVAKREGAAYTRGAEDVLKTQAARSGRKRS